MTVPHGTPELRKLQPAAVTESLRQSLVAIPALCLVLGVVLSELTIRVDRSGVRAWLPDSYETTSASGRVILGAIATGMITVVTLVLTLTLVAIQLAAGQLSPRTIANFLGDRFQQATVGVALGTATFSLLALRAVRIGGEGDAVSHPNLTVLVAVGLTLTGLVMLVLSVDRTASRLAVGTLLTDLAEETCALVDAKYGHDRRSGLEVERPGQLVGASPDEPWENTSPVSTDRPGWIQYIDEDGLLSAQPRGSRTRIRHPVGTFVFAGMALVEVDTADLDDDTAAALRAAIVVGDQRTLQQDVGFGLVRLTDIGLRALSPGVNDPNTAREVVLRLGQVILQLQRHQLPGGERREDDKALLRIAAPTHDDFATEAFQQISDAARDDRATLRTLRTTLDTIIDECENQELPGSTEELRRRLKLVTTRLDALDSLDES